MSLSATTIDENSVYCRAKFPTLSESISTDPVTLSNTNSYNKEGGSNQIKYLNNFKMIDYVFDNVLPTVPWMTLSFIIMLGFGGCGAAFFIRLCEKEKLMISPLDEKKAKKEVAKVEKEFLKKAEEEENRKKGKKKQESSSEESSEEEEDNEPVEGVNGVPFSQQTIDDAKGKNLLVLIIIKSVLTLLLLGAVGYGYTLLDAVGEDNVSIWWSSAKMGASLTKLLR